MGLSQKKNGLQNQPIDKTTDIIQPLNDTWGFKGADDNFWGITSSFDFTSISTQELNAWFAIVVTHIPHQNCHKRNEA